MKVKRQSSQVMSQRQSVERERALESVRELAHRLAKGVSQHQDLLRSVATNKAEVYVEESFQRRRFLFFSVTETRMVPRPQTVMKVLNTPPIYIAIDSQSGGQFVQRFTHDTMHVIDPDILHTQTILQLEKELQTLYRGLFPS
jgi:hypothetical protein